MPQIERQGSQSVAYSYMYPRVISGICEFCGPIDPLSPSEVQYQLCPHFKGIGELRCSYCPDNISPLDVIKQRELKVHVHPDNPSKLVVVCDDYKCSQKHLERFKIN